MFVLPQLPYARDALEPHMSAETLALHHGKHHKSYIDTLNALLVDDEMESLPLTGVIEKSRGRADRQAVFNNAAQSWNHDFFWKSMKAGGGGPVQGDLKTLIERDIGDDATFAEAFAKMAAQHFGSGWVWLVATEGVVGILTTHDAELPAGDGRTPLLCCD